MSHQPADSPNPATVPPVSGLRRVRRYLSERPLLLTLIDAFDQGANGSITFVDASGNEHAMRLLHGLPAGVETRRDLAPLGAILRQMGLSEEETLEVRLASGSRYDMLTARSLAIRGKLPDQVLSEAMRYQLMERMRFLLELPGDTLYSCHPDENLLSSFHPREPIECSEAELLSLVAEGVRMKRMELPVAHTLRLLKDVPLCIRDDAPVWLLGLSRDELAVLDVLSNESLTARQLVSCDVVPRGVVGVVVYLLGVLRYFDLPGDHRAPVGSKRRCRSGVVRRG